MDQTEWLNLRLIGFIILELFAQPIGFTVKCRNPGLHWFKNGNESSIPEFLSAVFEWTDLPSSFQLSNPIHLESSIANALYNTGYSMLDRYLEAFAFQWELLTPTFTPGASSCEI